ncbi:substrate-binding periplasmic protein [Neptuniibacter sp. SY11_33]|uniref:substrate-binding periplasmic protein n=1 Tax=Neptuniibacter sp. SY11_33 TaxID=3398215 RepID=UPI0039F4D056
MLRLIFAATFFLYCSIGLAAEKIVIAADRWCPFNCEANAPLPGFMIEVATEVFAEKGIEVQYKEMNWSRAIQEAKKGHINAVVGAFKGDVPGFVLPEQELAILGNTFFVHKDSNWQYQGVESLQGHQLAAISGYDYGDELRDYIQNNSSDSVTMLGSEQPLHRGIQMLSLKRIDMLVEAEPVFLYTANLLNKADHFKVAGSAKEFEKSYIAFSPILDDSQGYAQILSDGIDRLRKSGQLQEILSKYGMTDWREQ